MLKNRTTHIGLVFIGSLVFFTLLFLIGPWTDIQDHVMSVELVMSGEWWIPNFLFFVVVYVLALGQMTTAFLSGAGILAMAAAITAKFALVRHYLEKETKSLVGLSAIALSLLVVFSFPDIKPDQYLLGHISPNIWHNSTTIFLMPFAIMLFWLSKKYLKKPEKRLILPIIGLILLNLLIKPSFFFCLVVIFPLLSLIRFRLTKNFFLSLIPVFLGGIILLLQYLIIFEWGPAAGNQEQSSLQLNPFHVWSHFSNNIPLSFFLSMAFPLIYAIIIRKSLFADLGLTYAWGLFFFGLLIYILLTETGEREFHKNFDWQNVVCAFMVYWMSLRHYLNRLNHSNERNWRMWVPGIIFLMQCLSGVVYLGRILFGKIYY